MPKIRVTWKYEVDGVVKRGHGKWVSDTEDMQVLLRDSLEALRVRFPAFADRISIERKVPRKRVPKDPKALHSSTSHLPLWPSVADGPGGEVEGAPLLESSVEKQPLQLTRLFYVSRAAMQEASVIKDILREAREFNAINGISGLLTFDGEHFTQVLEGPASVVDSLMDRIRADNRHADVQILSSQVVPARYFQGWDMGYVYDRGLADEVASLLKVSGAESKHVGIFVEDLRGYTSQLR